MRFLTFNLTIAAALFYLMVGGDIQQAKALLTPAPDAKVESQQQAASPAPEPVERRLAKLGDSSESPDKALESLAKSLKIDSTEQDYLPPERRAPVKKAAVKKAAEQKAGVKKVAPAPRPDPEKVKTKNAELPPLDGEKVVEHRIPQPAPQGVSAGITPKAPQKLPEPSPVVAKVETAEPEPMDEDRQLARKKELSRMVFDMERLFAEKLTR